jgi:hypothetical protein
MRATYKILFAISMTMATAIATAQNASSGDVCGRLIDHGLYNISSKYSSYALADRVYWRFCDERYENMSESKKAEFGVTIKGLPFTAAGNATSNSETWSRFCGTYKTSTDINSSQSAFTARMHDRAIDAWRSCTTAAASGMTIDYRIPANQKYADVFLRYTGPSGTTKFNGIESLGFVCSLNGTQIGPGSAFDITPAETALRCERQSITQNVGGVTSDYYPDGGITVKTAAGNASAEFVAMVDGPAKNRFEQVDTSIAGVRNDMNIQAARLLSWPSGDAVRGNKLGWGNHGGAAACPAGSYMVGFDYWVAPPSIRFCVGCGSGIQPICRPINSTPTAASP